MRLSIDKIIEEENNSSITKSIKKLIDRNIHHKKKDGQLNQLIEKKISTLTVNISKKAASHGVTYGLVLITGIGAAVTFPLHGGLGFVIPLAAFGASTAVGYGVTKTLDTLSRKRRKKAAISSYGKIYEDVKNESSQEKIDADIKSDKGNAERIAQSYINNSLYSRLTKNNISDKEKEFDRMKRGLIFSSAKIIKDGMNNELFRKVLEFDYVYELFFSKLEEYHNNRDQLFTIASEKKQTKENQNIIEKYIKSAAQLLYVSKNLDKNILELREVLDYRFAALHQISLEINDIQTRGGFSTAREQTKHVVEKDIWLYNDYSNKITALFGLPKSSLGEQKALKESLLSMRKEVFSKKLSDNKQVEVIAEDIDKTSDKVDLDRIHWKDILGN